jgi:uncharacterized protein (TIGR02646 family)
VNCNLALRTIELLRLSIPVRSAVEQKNRYQQYRTELKADFNSRCGYCDAHDDVIWARGHYHIDHFAPHSLFPVLKQTYENLVYSCPFCNRAKSSKWHGNDAAVHNDGSRGFVDPCTEDYDQHVSRTDDGRIIALTELGRYVVIELKLQLARHQMAWQSEVFLKLRDRVNALLDDPRLEGDQRLALLEEFRELTHSYEHSKRAAL